MLWLTAGCEIDEELIKKELLKESKAQLLLDILNSFDIHVEEKNIKITDNFEKVFVNLGNKELIRIYDDCMEPVIPNNSHIGIEYKDHYSNGDIVYFEYQNVCHCRVFQKINENTHLLYSYKNNKNFLLNKNEYKILGKVNKITIDL